MIKNTFIFLTLFLTISCVQTVKKNELKTYSHKKSSCIHSKYKKDLFTLKKRAISSIQKSPERSIFDPHIHYWNDYDFTEIENYISKMNVHGGIIIASAYVANSPELTVIDETDEDYVESVFSARSRQETYRKTAEYLASKNDNFMGLCGINTDWEDLLEMTTYCLNLKKMKGLKVYGSISTKYDLYGRLDMLLLKHDNPLIILIHPDTNYTSLYDSNVSKNKLELNQEKNKNIESKQAFTDNNKVADSLLNIILKHPKHTFILAHVVDGFFGAKALLRETIEVQRPLPENLFFDISDVLYPLNTPPDIISDWKRIGLERLMFSTDYYNTEKDEGSIFQPSYYYEYLKKLTLLNKKEKDIILYESSKNFLKYYKSQY